jgi:hypothetical protein
MIELGAPFRWSYWSDATYNGSTGEYLFLMKPGCMSGPHKLLVGCCTIITIAEELGGQGERVKARHEHAQTAGIGQNDVHSEEIIICNRHPGLCLSWSIARRIP